MSTRVFSLETDRRSVELLVCSVALVVAPHIANLAATIMGFFALLILWRLAAARRKVSLPGRWILLLLTIAGAALVFAEYRRFYGREAGAALFTTGLGLKLMELRSGRDAYLAIFLAFFVGVTQYLFSQSIPMALYTLAIVALLVTTLISLNASEAFPLRRQFRMAASLTLQAVPLMLLLFLLFPRIPGPLWKLPDDQPQARSGLSDTIEPGSIGKLGLSQELAFRAQFEGTPPPPRLRYWRGPVFWHTDGFRWTLSVERGREKAPAPTLRGAPTRYTVILEPNQQHWVFALDLPSEHPGELRQTEEFLLLARDEIHERRQYRLASHTDYATGAITARARKLGLQLPSATPPRLKELVHGWKQKDTSDRALIDEALGYFRREPFYYTLNPPLTSGNPVESFLFDTRKGFCEHYATAFVVLMRIAGIPARVVTGYQGGSWNAVGRFIEVRQADAHAWAEVWLDGNGWTRIDPTAAVAPERIEYGLDVDSQVATGEIRFNPLDSALSDRALALGDLLRQARLIWDSVDHAWNLWVLSYGPENQARVMQLLGVVDWQKLAWLLTGSMVFALLVLAWFILPHGEHQPDRAQRLYGRFLRKLARRGLVKGPAEGALAFSRRVMAALPGEADRVGAITQLFLDLRYGRPGSPERLRLLHDLVKKFQV